MNLKLGLHFYLLFLAGSAIAQPPAPTAKSELILRFDVDLVQVDVVVTDRHGNHVGTLTPADFRVFQDGKPQEIKHLNYVAPRAASPEPVAAVNSRRQLTKEDVTRSIVLLIDDENMRIGDFVFAQR